MAGNQVLEWTELHSEFLTSGVKSVSDLAVTSAFQYNLMTIMHSLGPPCAPRPVSVDVLFLTSYMPNCEMFRLVDGSIRHNFRTAYSWIYNTPIGRAFFC